MARPTKLTPEVQAAIVQAITGGNTRETSAAYAGIGTSTFYKWLDEGREDGARRQFREFVEAVEKAEADAQVVSVTLVRRAAQTSWQAAAWWLERRYHAEWGRKDQVKTEVTGSGGGPVQIITTEQPLGFGG